VVLGVLLRIELSAVGPTIMEAQTYNAVFTLHGVIMVFLFLIPAMPAIFGNFLLPIQIGAQGELAPARVSCHALIWRGSYLTFAISGDRYVSHVA
jgi:heme/copper-type cytochrome/quinol oxidase subunit 1